MNSKERRALIRVGFALLTELMHTVYASDPAGALKAVVVEAVAQDPDIYQKSPASADTAV
jgi:hypothetical protein